MSRWFLQACLAEGGLAGVALLLAWLLGMDLRAGWQFDTRAVVGAGAGVLPPLGLLIWALRSSWEPVVHLRRRLDPVLQSFLGSWTAWELGVLSVCAGLGEEVLFRGVIQSWLAQGWGDGVGLVVTAVLFGFMHPITRFYVVLASLLGLWFGCVWLWSGSLLSPIVAHALYDFIALLACIRRRESSG